jgi:hypothetical protein
MSARKLKTLVDSAPIENEETLHHSFLLPVKPIAAAPEPFTWCGSPWSHVFMRALIHVEDILSICCALLLDNKNSTVIKLGTCVISEFCQL